MGFLYVYPHVFWKEARYTRHRLAFNHNYSRWSGAM